MRAPVRPDGAACDRSMSVHQGAITLFGRATFGIVCGTNSTSAATPPPTTTYPFDVIPTRVYSSSPQRNAGTLKFAIVSSVMPPIGGDPEVAEGKVAACRGSAGA